MNILTTDQKVRLTARFVDRYGNPASIDGLPRWETSADGIVTVTPDADGMSADVVTDGALGTVQVRAVADSAMGDGERLIIGIADIQVVGGEARIVTLTAGAAEAKDDVPAPEPEPEPEPEPAPPTT